MKFEAEKKFYSELLHDIISGKAKTDEALYANLIQMRAISVLVHNQGDELVTIVSTESEEAANRPPTKEEIEIHHQPSPKCDKCVHSRISHNRKGCRFCDCEEKRSKGQK